MAPLILRQKTIGNAGPSLQSMGKKLYFHRRSVNCTLIYSKRKKDFAFEVQ